MKAAEDVLAGYLVNNDSSSDRDSNKFGNSRPSQPSEETHNTVVISFSSRLPWLGAVNQLLGCLKVSGRGFKSRAEHAI